MMQLICRGGWSTEYITLLSTSHIKMLTYLNHIPLHNKVQPRDIIFEIKIVKQQDTCI